LHVDHVPGVPPLHPSLAGGVGWGCGWSPALLVAYVFFAVTRARAAMPPRMPKSSVGSSNASAKQGRVVARFTKTKTRTYKYR
jgi:hypothetical protein